MAGDVQPRRLPRPPIFRTLTRDDCGDQAGLLCPLLLEQIPLGREIAVCGDCATIHDANAWRENRGCATLGCASRPDARRDAPESVLRVSAEDVSRVVAPPPVPPLIPIQSPGFRAPPPVPPAPLGSRVPPPPPPPPIPRAPVWPAPSVFPAGVIPPSAPPPLPVATPSVRSIERAARADEAGKSCPYSMEPFAAGDAVAECPKCGQVLSAESWRENRGCTTYGCEGAPDFRKDAPRVPPPIL